MWGNLSGVVGAAIQKVQKIQTDIETQLDQAVGVDNRNNTGNNVIILATENADEKLKSEENAQLLSESVDAVDQTIKNEHENLKFPEAVTTVAGIKSEQRSSPNDVDANVKHELSIKDIKAKAIEKLKSQELKFNAEREEWKSQLEILQNMRIEHEKELSSVRAQHMADMLKSKNEYELKLIDQQKHFEKVHQQEVLKLETNYQEVNGYLPQGTDSSESTFIMSQKMAGLEKIVEDLRDELRDQEFQSDEKIKIIKSEAHALKLSLATAQQEVVDLTKQIQALTDTQNQLLLDIESKKEIIKDRERALEAAVEQSSELRNSLDDLQQVLTNLKSESSEKEARLKIFQNSVTDESDTKKEIAHLNDLIRERDVRLLAFEEEGRSLAKKQSEMEKNVRKCKQELREKENEVTKLKENREQLIKTIEQTQEVLKKNELEALNTSKTLSAMQAVSQASTEKLSRLEADISSKCEELSSQRRALEIAWNENNELKRVIAELKAERDDMKRQLGEGTSKVLETETSRREIEQREAVLRATSRQLQESLQSQMKDSSFREERLREEIHEMRRKWQEAVSSRESLASELAQATSPLLRQISSMQETLRIKTEQWQNIESHLSERALRAENAIETFEHKKSLLEDQILNLKQQLSIATTRLHDYQANLNTAEAALDRYKRFEIGWSEEKHDLESKLALEVAQRNSLHTSLRELEMRHRIDMQDALEKGSVICASKDAELARLGKQLEALHAELTEERSGRRIKTQLSKNREEGDVLKTFSQTLPSKHFSYASD